MGLCADTWQAGARLFNHPLVHFLIPSHELWFLGRGNRWKGKQFSICSLSNIHEYSMQSIPAFLFNLNISHSVHFESCHCIYHQHCTSIFIKYYENYEELASSYKIPVFIDKDCFHGFHISHALYFQYLWNSSVPSEIRVSYSFSCKLVHAVL